ncbi:MAG: hypothetical protein EBU32_07170 [Opitutaceae bacterium]|nr:hypothetical protein [Opitutaceae bacterium]
MLHAAPVLSSLGRAAAERNFFSVDRFRIINLSCVEKVERVTRNKMLVYLTGLNQPKELRRIASARLAQRLKAHVGLNRAKLPTPAPTS